MLGLGTAAVFPGARLQRADNAFVDVADDQISHDVHPSAMVCGADDSIDSAAAFTATHWAMDQADKILGFPRCTKATVFPMKSVQSIMGGRAKTVSVEFAGIFLSVGPLLRT